MLWEELTAPALAAAARSTGGVCLLPLGVLEKHGEHLPLGTDSLTAHALAAKAAQVEPAVVFPAHHYTQIHEAKHQPGAIAISCRLMLELLGELCGEIARNGFRKIILVNGHGGNNGMLQHLLRSGLERRLPYTLYVLDLRLYHAYEDPAWKAMVQSGVTGDHAGEHETSLMLHLRPELVRMDAIGGDGRPRRRLAHLDGLGTSIGWYADQPDHYSGDATPATAAKGAWLCEHAVARIAHYLRIVRADTATAALTDEFFARVEGRA